MNLVHKVGILIMGVIITTSVFSQNPGFNRFYQLSETNNTHAVKAVFENQQGYVAIGYSNFCYTYDSTCTPYSLFFSQFNSAGDLLWSREYSNDTVTLYGFQCKPVKSGDSVYEWVIVCDDTINGNHRRFPVVVRFNEEGEVTSLKEIRRPQNLGSSPFYPYISIKTADSGFLIGFLTTREDYLLKVNKDLETEWGKHINLQNKKGRIRSLYQVKDSSYLIGMKLKDDPATELVYFSPDGELNWSRTTGSELGAVTCKVLEGADSSLVIINDYIVYQGPYGLVWENKFQFTAFDKSGQLKSSTIIGDSVEYAMLTGAFTDSDGTIVFYGGEGAGAWVSFVNTFIFRITQAGDSLFYRKVKPQYYPYRNNCSFEDGIPTSDGNLLFCGMQDIDEKTGSYYYHELGWLVKTDWYGCYDVPVITENPVSVVAPENDEVLFSVATADTVLHYEWYFNNTLLPQSDSNVLVIHPVTSANKGEYYCTVRNECGSARSEVARLDILGVDEMKSSNRLRIYPNPNTGQFHLLNAKPTDLDKIEVYNSQGIKVNHKMIKPDIIMLPDNKDSGGIYFLRCDEITLRLVLSSE